jgi:aspartate aminotransferase
MSEFVTERIRNIQESSTIRMSKLSRELRDKGQDIINLSLGEPDFDTPDHIKEAAILAIQEGYTHYPPVAGYPELRKAIAEKFAAAKWNCIITGRRSEKIRGSS